MTIKRILVPTDFSAPANHAVEQAAELAIRHGAKLHLLHVIELAAEEEPSAKAILGDYLKRLRDEADESLALKLEVIQGNDVDVDYTTVSGRPAYQAILECIDEEKPDLVVMGTHGRTGMGRLLIGSMTEKVLRHSEASLLTVHKETPIVRAAQAFERILVPVDFSDFSLRAAEMASTLAGDDGSVEVIHIVASPIHPSFYAAGMVRIFQVDPELPGRIKERIEEFLPFEPAEIIVREGDVFTELMDAARERSPQLVVMGTKGLTGLDHLLVGSLTERMVRRALLPILTVK